MNFEIPSEQNTVISDWVELYVIAQNITLSKQTLTNLIKINLPEVVEDERENLVNSVFQELDYRAKSLYRECSHFKITNDLVEPTKTLDELPETALCLIFSLKGVVVQKGKNNGTKLFEEICNIAAKEYLGNSYLLGFPNNKNLLSQLKQSCKESCETIGHEIPRPVDKDGGVDIIAWKTFDDDRRNKVVVLIQCGAGKHFDKKHPINIVRWKRWINWAFEPLTGISTPKLIRDEYEWQNLSDNYKLIFDRPRIIKFVFNSQRDTDLQNRVASWCKSRLN